MLSRKNRVPSDQIRTVLQSGKRYNTPEYILTVRKKSEGLPCFAVIVSTKRVKHAVNRNRVKRLLRESFHHLLPVLVPCDCVANVQRDFSSTKQSDVETGLYQLFRSNGLTHEAHV